MARYAALAGGVAAVSFSAIFIRLAHAPALAMAFWRNVIATALLAPVALLRHRPQFRAMSRGEVLVAGSAGVLLAGHFATWIPSLRYTTVAASTVLVTAAPVFTAMAARWTGERVSGRTWAGIAVALAGAMVVSGGDVTVSGRAVFGDLLATLGAVFAAGYFLIGRSLRRRLPLLVYVTVVYATCAAVLGIVMAAGGTAFTGYPTGTWGLFVLMALLPQILGHTVFNYLLRDLDPTVITVGIMGEPVGASLLALAIFGEVPGWWTAVGGALILAGIYVAVHAQRDVAVPVE